MDVSRTPTTTDREPGWHGFDRFTGLAVAAGVLAVAAFVLAAEVTDRPLSDFTRDPTSAAGASFLLGYASNLMVAVWLSGGIAALVAAAALAAAGDRPGARPFWATGALTLVLTADDLFQLHEEALPYYLGLPQLLVIGAYGAATLAVGVAHRRWIAAHGWPLLALALALLGCSVLTDALEAEGSLVGRLLEDGAKLVGVTAWTAFLARAAVRTLGGRLRPAP